MGGEADSSIFDIAPSGMIKPDAGIATWRAAARHEEQRHSTGGGDGEMDASPHLFAGCCSCARAAPARPTHEEEDRSAESSALAAHGTCGGPWVACRGTEMDQATTHSGCT